MEIQEVSTTAQPDPPIVVRDHGFYKSVVKHLQQERTYFDGEILKIQTEKLSRSAKKTPRENNRPARAMYTIPAKRSGSDDDPPSPEWSCDRRPQWTNGDQDTSITLDTSPSSIPQSSDTDPDPTIDVMLRCRSMAEKLEAAMTDPSTLSLHDIFHIGHDIVHSACSNIPLAVANYASIYKKEADSEGDYKRYRITLAICTIITTEFEMFKLSTVLLFLQNLVHATAAVEREHLILVLVCKAVLDVVKGGMKNGETQHLPHILNTLLVTGPLLAENCLTKFQKIIAKLRKIDTKNMKTRDIIVVYNIVALSEVWVKGAKAIEPLVESVVAETICEPVKVADVIMKESVIAESRNLHVMWRDQID